MNIVKPISVRNYAKATVIVVVLGLLLAFIAFLVLRDIPSGISRVVLGIPAQDQSEHPDTEVPLVSMVEQHIRAGSSDPASSEQKDSEAELDSPGEASGWSLSTDIENEVVEFAGPNQEAGSSNSQATPSDAEKLDPKRAPEAHQHAMTVGPDHDGEEAPRLILTVDTQTALRHVRNGHLFLVISARATDGTLRNFLAEIEGNNLHLQRLSEGHDAPLSRRGFDARSMEGTAPLAARVSRILQSMDAQLEHMLFFFEINADKMVLQQQLAAVEEVDVDWRHAVEDGIQIHTYAKLWSCDAAIGISVFSITVGSRTIDVSPQHQACES